jgi:hypothetical protein
VEVGFGLTRLPEPSEGDIFLELEGDPFAGKHFLEYLFGYVSQDSGGALEYRHSWGLSRADEKRVSGLRRLRHGGLGRIPRHASDGQEPGQLLASQGGQSVHLIERRLP